jgi:hypothetical protein
MNSLDGRQLALRSALIQYRFYRCGKLPLFGNFFFCYCIWTGDDDPKD